MLLFTIHTLVNLCIRLSNYIFLSKGLGIFFEIFSANETSKSVTLVLGVLARLLLSLLDHLFNVEGGIDVLTNIDIFGRDLLTQVRQQAQVGMALYPTRSDHPQDIDL